MEKDNKNKPLKIKIYKSFESIISLIRIYPEKITRAPKIPK